MSLEALIARTFPDGVPQTEPRFGDGKEPGEQGSVEWLMERVGHVTASRFCDVMAKLKNGSPAKARNDYVWELVIERLTQKPKQHYTTEAMLWGTEQEQFSKMDYEARTGRIVEKSGFVKHPSMAWVGGSPDGLIDDDGGWESKSPYSSAVHLQTILTGMPADHTAQVQGLMWITGRAWWDFSSFDPRLPPEYQHHIQRIERDDDYIANLAGEVAAFLGEVEDRLMQLAERVAI